MLSVLDFELLSHRERPQNQEMTLASYSLVFGSSGFSCLSHIIYLYHTISVRSRWQSPHLVCSDSSFCPCWINRLRWCPQNWSEFLLLFTAASGIVSYSHKICPTSFLPGHEAEGRSPTFTALAFVVQIINISFASRLKQHELKMNKLKYHIFFFLGNKDWILQTLAQLASLLTSA